MDTSPSNLQLFLGRPVVKWLTVMNVVLFPIVLLLASGNFTRLGLVPELFLDRLEHFQLIPAFLDLVRYQFVHENIEHILFNMLFLVTMGIPLEYVLGSRRFAMLYFVSGMISGLLFALTAPPMVVMIGASGAIAGVMGGALVLNRQQELIGPIGGFSIKAVHVLTGWFVWQVYLLSVSLIANDVQSGEFILHVTGFITGAALSVLWKPSTN